MQITSIKPQKRGKRVTIFIDNKYGFGLDLENFMKLSLKVGQNLTKKEVNEITRKGDFSKVLNSLLRFATIRPRSEKEIINWFKRKKVDSDFQKDLLARLVRLELLDDEKFAKWWVDQRNNFRPKSKRVLRQELSFKGIGKNIIENVLFESKINEAKIAQGLLEKKKYKWEKMTEKESKIKKKEFLARKGFSWNVIKEVL